MIFILLLTVLSIFLVIYHHIGYPLILRFAQRLRGDVVLVEYEHCHYQAAAKGSDNLPHVTVVMPTFNEENYIAEKIHNLACQDYPETRLHIIVACDGCTDNTVEIAQKAAASELCKHLSIEIRAFDINRGKIAMLNDVLPKIDSDIVALTDVSSLVSIDALAIAAQRFQDPTVGAVNGNYRILNSGSTGEEVYWNYQRRIKIGEEALGSVLGAHGAFYLIRTKLFQPLQNNTVNDDFVVPMRVIEQGFRVIYEPRLNALELEQANLDVDWHRRLRISMGNAQQIALLYRLFNPKYKGVALAFFSGKGLRVAMPFLLLVSLMGSIILSAFIPIFILIALVQVGVYLTALWIQVTSPTKPSKIAKILHYIVAGHTASFIGCVRYIFNASVTRW